MLHINVIVGSYILHNITKAYVNVVNDIDIFVERIPPTNTITNETILTQYSIIQGMKFLEKVEATVQN